MNKWTSILLSVVVLLICYLCFTQIDKLIQGICWLIAIFYAFVAYWFLFERIKLKDDWLKSQTGKAAFPGSLRACITLGVAALTIAAVFAFWGLRH